MCLILCLHCGGKQLGKLLARKLIIVTDDMFGFIKSHFPNARIEFVHSPLFSLVLFCRPTHHGKNPKEVFNRMGHICRLQEIFLNSLRGRMGVLSLSLYTAIRPIQVRGMVWIRLFLFAVLPRLWWEISLPINESRPRKLVALMRQFAC